MDAFENELKRVSLARPSGELRGRIFADGPQRSWFANVFSVRIPLGWAAAFALITGLAGMNVAQWGGGGPAPSHRPEAVYIIQAPSEGNPFDFTESVADFMPGKLTVKVDVPKEI